MKSLSSLKSWLSFLFVCLLLLTQTGCAFVDALNLKNAERYHDAGLLASMDGRHLHAREMFSRAAIYAELGDSPASGKSMALYNWARQSALTGDYGAAKEGFREALEIERGIEPQNRAVISMRLCEMARMLHDIGEHREALPYFEEALEVLNQLNAAQQDPGAVAVFYDKYAESLEATGHSVESAAIRRSSAALRRDSNHAAPKFVADRYTAEAVAERIRAEKSRHPEQGDEKTPH